MLCLRAMVDAGKAHKCMNCGGFAHGVFCCFEWCERSDHGIILTPSRAKGVKSPLPAAMVQHLNSNNNKSDLCFKCLGDIKKKIDDARNKVSATQTITTATSSASAQAADVLAAVDPLIFTDAPATKQKKQTRLKAAPTKKKSQDKHERKKMTRLTINQKLEVLDYIKCGSSTREACKQFGCSRQSISKWNKEVDNLIKSAQFNGKATRVVKDDGLMRIKIGILAFYDLNKSMPKDAQINITGDIISARAKTIRNRLLERHQESPFLTDDEVKKMQKCQFSQSWGIKMAQKNGRRSKKLHGEAGSVDVVKATPHIDKICTLIAEYDLDHVYNMDETGLFFKCLPNRSYLRKEDFKDARGSKLMKAKDRVTIYVCTNADGTDKVPLSMIGKPKQPRCFVNRTLEMKYYSQRSAWSDTVTFKKWWKFFRRHIRTRTGKKVLLILDNCGLHGEELIDPTGQVTVIFLPPNCTSMFQPMDSGVIAMLKKNYRTRLLMILLENYDDRETLSK